MCIPTNKNDVCTFAGTPQQQVWRVRPYAPTDFSALVQLQTDSFHTPLPLKALDKLAKTSLRAEVRQVHNSL